VLELLPFAPTDKREILDLGAGTGLLSAKIAGRLPEGTAYFVRSRSRDARRTLSASSPLARVSASS
jgi:16S rRNA G1207 methylase RsmC